MKGTLPHITVCICTYRRAELLDTLLSALQNQKTRNQFTFSVRIVDNDFAQSATLVAEKWKTSSLVQVEYLLEPCQNIARARNCAVAGLGREYIAMLDDDEVPCDDWLFRLFSLIENSFADGILGPVRPAYPSGCPAWLQLSGLCDRPTHATGQELEYYQTRTGNVLFRRNLFVGEVEPFKVEFGLEGGEDIDFFKRKIAQGHRFVWCNEAEAFETVPKSRWNLGYYFRRQLRLGGLLGERQKSVLQTVRSFFSCLVHGVSCLSMLGFGKQHYSKYIVRFAYHFGYLCAALGVSWSRTRDEILIASPGKQKGSQCQSSHI